MNRIKELRQNKGLTQEELAELIFSKQQAINSYENEKYEPDIATLKRLALMFETSIDYIVGLVDIKTPINKVQKCELNEYELAFLECYRKLPRELQKDFYKILFDIIEELSNMK